MDDDISDLSASDIPTEDVPSDYELLDLLSGSREDHVQNFDEL